MKRKIILSLFGVATAGLMAFGGANLNPIPHEFGVQQLTPCPTEEEPLDQDVCYENGSGTQCNIVSTGQPAVKTAACTIPLYRNP